MNKHEGVSDLFDDVAQEIDWHELTEEQGRSLGLSLGLFRESALQISIRNATLYATFGAVMNVVAMCFVGWLLNSATCALIGITVSQLARLLWLWYQKTRSAQGFEYLHKQVVEQLQTLPKLK